MWKHDMTFDLIKIFEIDIFLFPSLILVFPRETPLRSASRDLQVSSHDAAEPTFRLINLVNDPD